MMALALAAAFSLPTMTQACTEDGKSGFSPVDGRPVPVGEKSANIASEDDFNAIIDSVVHVYEPIVASMGGKLQVTRKWTDATANASATRSFGVWNLNMYGGLARNEHITPDGFRLVVCHELGHHIGGAPKMPGLLGLGAWASNEGQADYFATLKCLRRVFLNDNNRAIVAEMKDVPARLTESCQKAYREDGEQAMCVRIGMAGQSTANFLASAASKPLPDFTTPDASVVSKTNNAHPAAQCRLDTYLQGVVCEKALGEDVDQKDEVRGTCHPSTGQTVGNRPLCWFKPKA